MKKDFSQLRISMEKEAIDALTKKPIITYSSERVRLWSAIAKEVAERVIFMCDGIIEEEGTPDEIFDDPKSPRLQQFLAKVL